MMRVVIVLLALVSLSALQQSPYDPDGHLKSEHQIPAGHACMQRRVFEENAQRLTALGKRQSDMLHPCDCTYSCVIDENGNVQESDGEKNPGCKSYCSKDGRKCGCHVEEPCLGTKNALVDMHGTVVAERTRSTHQGNP